MIKIFKYYNIKKKNGIAIEHVLDNNGSYHNTNGAALIWENGEKAYYLNGKLIGRNVPRDFENTITFENDKEFIGWQRMKAFF